MHGLFQQIPQPVGVFDRRDLVSWLSFGDGWLSLITGSDFSRGNIVKSFLRAAPR